MVIRNRIHMWFQMQRRANVRSPLFYHISLAIMLLGLLTSCDQPIASVPNNTATSASPSATLVNASQTRIETSVPPRSSTAAPVNTASTLTTAPQSVPPHDNQEKDSVSMAEAWGKQPDITKIPIAVDTNHVFVFNAITPDARYLLGAVVDRKSDPEIFQDIEPRRWGLLEVNTRKFTEIRRLPDAHMQAFTSPENIDQEWAVWTEASRQPNFEDWTIYAYHIPTKQIKQIAQAPVDQRGRSLDTRYTDVHMSQGYVVWTEALHADDLQAVRVIKLMNIATGKTETLTNKGMTPRISWPYVAWVEPQAEDSTLVQGASRAVIVVLNMENSERKTLKKVDTPAYFAIDGQDIVWVRLRQHQPVQPDDIQQVVLTNINETSEQVIQSSEVITEELSFPTLSHRFIGWRSNLKSYVYDRVLGHLVLLDTNEWQTEPKVNGYGLVWMPKGEQTLEMVPSERGLRPNTGVLYVLNAATLPLKPPRS